jgi:hypothetical protein
LPDFEAISQTPLPQLPSVVQIGFAWLPHLSGWRRQSQNPPQHASKQAPRQMALRQQQPVREDYMGVSEILATIDHEIAQLQQARALLSGGVAPTAKKKAGRPKKVVVAAPKKAVAAVVPAATKPAKKKKRNLSPEGRKRIAEAVKRRWAAQKAAAAK